MSTSPANFTWPSPSLWTTAVLAISIASWFPRVVSFLRQSGKKEKSLYGLQHGRLHLDAQVPMWMNMGYWKVDGQARDGERKRTKTLAEACRDMLNLVLSEAEISGEGKEARKRCLIDVGFGCGEQTIHLMSDKPVRPSDKLWWDDEKHGVFFNQYIGITKDAAQCEYAQDRVSELGTGNIRLFCADAANPQLWDEQVKGAVEEARSETDETWLLALDTAYHFSPSRWEVVQHAHDKLEASFMAFDLCLSPTATAGQRWWLRALTMLMGAPWANFDTPAVYGRKLEDVGYSKKDVKIVDMSEHVFQHLAEYLESQDARLKMLGMGIGSFAAAKWLFGWWGRTGVVRGVVVVARHRGAGSLH